MNIVLVHGGWHGGWCWQRLTPLLEAVGHHVTSPTLTGLGERSHLAHADVTPDLHVTDIVNHLRWNELEHVLLVGHSYGGFVISGVASQVPERIAGLVYLDAFVPTGSGQSAFSIGNAARAAEVRATMTDGFLVPATRFQHWSRDPKTIAWLRRMVTPHPVRCFEEGPTLTGRERDVAEKLYIWCEQHDPSPFRPFYERCAADPSWRTACLPCLHDAMLDEPQALAGLILQSAERAIAPSGHRGDAKR